MDIANLSLRLDSAFRSAIATAFPRVDADPLVRRSDRADFQVNAAIALAKKLGRNGQGLEIAKAIIAALEADPVGSTLVEKLEAAGPGFINVRVSRAALESGLDALARDPREGVPETRQKETVVIDYSAPNIAKELHVGHLRSTVIGDAIARILEATGHHVIRQNHIGDWGTAFGMLIEHLIDEGQGTLGAELSIKDLDGFYKSARAKFEADTGFQERARKRVVMLQAGDELSLGLWNQLCAVSRRSFQSAYQRLDVTLTDADIAGESFYNKELVPTIEELQAKGLIEESDGALCVFPDGFMTKEKTRLPLIARKSDGGYGYATTDLAAIRYRLGTLRATRLLYVVGAPQSQHLQMIFATAKKAGWVGEGTRVEHIAFGSVLGADKKILRARSGDSVKLQALIDEAIGRADEVARQKDANEAAPMTDEALTDAAQAIGIGSLKYADLCNDKIKDYIFDWARMLALDGNTAAYLIYAVARSRSIIRKAPEEIVRSGFADAPMIVAEPAERALALDLLAFSNAVDDVSSSLQFHSLCGAIYAIAKTFSSFYAACPVNSAPSPELVRSRLRLTDLTARTLTRGLGLIGVRTLSKM